MKKPRKFVFIMVGFIFSTHILMAQQGPSIGEAIRAIRFEQFEKAKTLLKAIGTPEADYYLGDVYFKEGTLDSAESFFQKTIVGATSSPFGYIGEGRIKQALGETEAAHNLFSKANSMLGDNYFAMLELGKAYVEDSKTKESDAIAAINILTAASNLKTLKSKPDQIYLALGDAYLAKPDGENAAKNYQLAMTSNPASAEPYAKFAKLYRVARNSVVSLDYAAQGIAKDPSFGPIYREQAETYRASNKIAEALNSYEKYLSLTDRSVNSRIRYIQFLYLDGNYDKANSELNDLKTALKGDFSKTPAMYRLDAISKYELWTKNKDKALAADGLASEQKLFAQKSVKPLSIDYSYLGKLYLANGNDSLAMVTMEQAIVQDSTHAEDIYPTLVDLYRSKKKYKEAAAIFAKRIEHDSTRINNYMNFGFYTYLTGDTTQFRKADRYLAKVNLKTPNYSDAWYYRGLVNFSLDPDNKTYAAQPYFQKVIDLYNTDSTFQKRVLTNAHFKNSVVQSYDYLLTYTSLKLKDNGAAKVIADKLIALDPTNRDAQIFLTQKKK